MRSELQTEASRANGRKSRGPVTAEGKVCSSRNAAKRQLIANSIALPAESTEEFLELLLQFRESLQPVGFPEERVVETITVSDWHRRRYRVPGMAGVAWLQMRISNGLAAAQHQPS